MTTSRSGLIWLLTLLFALLLSTGCGHTVTWSERTASDGSKMLVPCCPRCNRYVDHESTECRDCGKFLRWSERPGEEY